MPRRHPPARRRLARLRHGLLRSVASCGLLLLLGACQAQPAATPTAAPTPAPAPAPAPAAAEEAALLARIKAGIGAARCSSDAQCRSLGLGEKPCGGPAQWWAWSTSSPQAAQLPAWGAQLAALAKQRNTSSGMAGNCLYQPDPGTVCQAQRCVLAVPALAR